MIKKLGMKTNLIQKIEIDPIDVCNRSCSFCPRGVGYPNTKKKIEYDTAEAINKNLKSISYIGSISFAGMGEPLLHKNLENIIKTVIKDLNLKAVTVITNGDYLDKYKAKTLHEAGVTNIKISMYDDDQEKYFSSFLQDFEVVYKHYYNGPDYEVNRNEIYSDFTEHHFDRPCYLPFYKMFIDFNGDAFLCVNDWNKTICAGNLKEKHIEEVWNYFDEYRRMLKKGKRSMHPCSGCNVYGLREGKDSFERFA